ncbi:methionine adenosyltransferase 2 subunit beta [Rhypophila sp. PSN 637]
MAKKTVLVTGATGLLGRQVVRAFSYYAADSDEWIVKGTGFSRTATTAAAADGKPVQEIIKLDLADAGQVEALLDREKPRVVVHFPSAVPLAWLTVQLGAANRFPDKVDKDPEGTKALNVEASGRLARLCAQRGILLIYISTDYVFSGKPGEAPYEADAETGPTNLYGQTKLDGEKAVLGEFEAGGKRGFGVVLRVPILFGSAERTDESAVNVLLESVRKAAEGGNKIKMDHWALRYPTNTEDVGRVCHDVAVHYLFALDAGKQAELPKMLQFSSEDKYTKYEICRLFAEILGLPIDGIEANTEGNDPNASVQRPYDCHLSTRALKEVGIDVSTQDFEGWWRRELRAFRK